MAVRETQAMIRGMAPALDAVRYVFVVATSPEHLASSLCSFHEAEGLSLILPVEVAESLGYAIDLPMARITLEVFSALDGVGLTAAVSTALAEAGIPCNMVAAFSHDHAFVPVDMATRAMEVLTGLAARAAPEPQGNNSL